MTKRSLADESAAIRQLLERNAQAVEQPEEKSEPKRRGRRKGA